MSDFIRRYRKFLVAAIAGLAVLVTALADGKVDSHEWYLIIVAVLGPAGVGIIPNDPPQDPNTTRADKPLI